VNQNQTIGETANIPCIHIIIPNLVPVANIYFPTKGTQPTTLQAIKYSCANVDNTLNSRITVWYMKMFGVVPFQNGHNPAENDYIHAGWNNPAGAAPVGVRIIRFEFVEYVQDLANKLLQIIPHAPLQLNAVALAGPVLNITNQLNAATAPHLRQLAQDVEAARAHIVPLFAGAAAITNQRANQFISDIENSLAFLEQQLITVAIGQTVQQFIAILEPLFRNNFRRLASTSVGRVLLYRLLIEINRRTNGVTTGCCENNIPPQFHMLRILLS
jgi:hypothetical protein